MSTINLEKENYSVSIPDEVIWVPGLKKHFDISDGFENAFEIKEDQMYKYFDERNPR